VARPGFGSARAGRRTFELVRRFMAGLSPQTTYRRFFTGGRVTDRTIRQLIDVGGARDVLVACAGPDIVGLADYMLVAGRPDTAEIGIVVTDSWQRRGVGPHLTTELLARATSRGITTLQAYTLAENARVELLIRRNWPTARARREDTLLRWDLPARRS
jgi:acetyltransferase